MELQGKIKLINKAETFGTNGFRKREIVITTEEQYPQHVLVEFVQDRCDLLDKFEIGQTVTIGINLRGREWVNPQGETKYFNSIQGWKINEVASAPNTPAPPLETFEPVTDLKESEEDDLPF